MVCHRCEKLCVSLLASHWSQQSRANFFVQIVLLRNGSNHNNSVSSFLDVTGRLNGMSRIDCMNARYAVFQLNLQNSVENIPRQSKHLFRIFSQFHAISTGLSMKAVDQGIQLGSFFQDAKRWDNNSSAEGCIEIRQKTSTSIRLMESSLSQTQLSIFSSCSGIAKFEKQWQKARSCSDIMVAVHRRNVTSKDCKLRSPYNFWSGPSI